LGVQAGPVRSAVPPPRVDEGLVLLLGDLRDGERHRGGRHVEHRVDAVAVVPLPGDGGADIGLVLVVGGDDLDLQPLRLRLEVLDRHAGGHHRALAGGIEVDARAVVQDADLHRDEVGREGGAGAERAQAPEQSRDVVADRHVSLPVCPNAAALIAARFFSRGRLSGGDRSRYGNA
jgi:hypothetical protein